MFLTGTFLLVSLLTAYPQWRRPVISPEVQDDCSVIFRLYAPDAGSVKITGNWMPGWGHSVELARNDTGLYTIQTDPLPSEMYTYVFLVDGVRTIDPGNVQIVRDGVRNESMFIVPGGQGDLYQVHDIPHGAVTKIWYDSPTLGMQRRMYIYTPPGYHSGTDSYPVLYLLHGAGGDEDAWTTLGRTNYILDNLIAQGKARPMMVVMTNGVPTSAAAPTDRPVDLEKTGIESGGPGGMVSGKFEESLVKDVIPFVESHFRVKTGPMSRAIAGLSMGGYHTQVITNKYPGMFKYIGVMSMGLYGDNRFGNYSREEHEKQIRALIASKPELYWIGVGKEDFLYESVTNLRKFYDEMGLNYIYRETSGGHTWTNWRIYLSELAPLLFR